MWSRAPKHLPDDCLELEANIRSNSTHDIYKLDRKVPKTGETSDVSEFCKLERLELVMMFCDKTAPFPDEIFKLGHYLGPAEWISALQINMQTINPRWDSRQ